MARIEPDAGGRLFHTNVFLDERLSAGERNLEFYDGSQARLAAILLTAMYASFTPLVHIPMLLADPSKQFIWSENALNLVLAGVAWVVADALSNPEKRAA